MGQHHEVWREHLRIYILRMLEVAPNYSVNDSILADYSVRRGVAASRDLIRSELSWLREQGLATVEDLDGLWVATATARGLDVARGTATHPGVRRPSPR